MIIIIFVFFGAWLHCFRNLTFSSIGHDQVGSCNISNNNLFWLHFKYFESASHTPTNEHDSWPLYLCLWVICKFNLLTITSDNLLELRPPSVLTNKEIGVSFRTPKIDTHSISARMNSMDVMFFVCYYTTSFVKLTTITTMNVIPFLSSSNRPSRLINMEVRGLIGNGPGRLILQLSLTYRALRKSS